MNYSELARSNVGWVGWKRSKTIVRAKLRQQSITKLEILPMRGLSLQLLGVRAAVDLSVQLSCAMVNSS